MCTKKNCEINVVEMLSWGKKHQIQRSNKTEFTETKNALGWKGPSNPTPLTCWAKEVVLQISEFYSFVNIQTHLLFSAYTSSFSLEKHAGGIWQYGEFIQFSLNVEYAEILTISFSMHVVWQSTLAIQYCLR